MDDINTKLLVIKTFYIKVYILYHTDFLIKWN